MVEHRAYNKDQEEMVGLVAMSRHNQKGPKRGRKMGRPRELTPELQTTIEMMLKAGNYLETAADYSGCPMENIRRWMRRGAREHKRMIRARLANPSRDEAIFRNFWLALKKARATSEASDLEIIRRASAKNWCAAAWRLERKNPKKWGRKDRAEISGPGGGPIKTQQTESFYELAERVAAERAADQKTK